MTMMTREAAAGGARQSASAALRSMLCSPEHGHAFEFAAMAIDIEIVRIGIQPPLVASCSWTANSCSHLDDRSVALMLRMQRAAAAGLGKHGGQDQA